MGGDPGRRRSRSRPPRDAIRGDRERKIRGIIAERPVGTQEEMAAALGCCDRSRPVKVVRQHDVDGIELFAFQ